MNLQTNENITAKIITDSINPDGDRLTTFVLVMPRIVLAEFNTHRVISRNSASSRAIPFHKMLESVQNNPFIPLGFQKDHKGMQGTEYFEGLECIHANEHWLFAKDKAVESAKFLSELGVTKQLCNRLLEPFLYHTVIATSSDWGNFFALRAHEAAEIHIQNLAYKMLDAYNQSTPKKVKHGEWHIPFGDTFDDFRLYGMVKDENKDNVNIQMNELKVKIATARAARISYNNFEGKDDYEADIKLHDNLLASGHLSPFEHCAQVEADGISNGGNFGIGWNQYRKMFQNENRSDSRVGKL